MRAEWAALEAERRVQRVRRHGLRRVALCGYTNAGKSTLFRALTGTEAYVADKRFAAPDTTVRALQPEARPRILVSDIIGPQLADPARGLLQDKSTRERRSRPR